MGLKEFCTKCGGTGSVEVYAYNAFDELEHRYDPCSCQYQETGTTFFKPVGYKGKTYKDSISLVLAKIQDTIKELGTTRNRKQ